VQIQAPARGALVCAAVPEAPAAVVITVQLFKEHSFPQSCRTLQFCSKMTYLILMHALFETVKEYIMNIHKLKLI